MVKKAAPTAVPANVGEISADSIFSFGMRTIFARMASYPVTVTTESQDPRATAYAENMQQRWRATLSWMAKSFKDGRAAFELIWFYDEKHRIAALDELLYLEPAISDQNIEDGQFAGVWLLGEEDSATQERERDLLPVGRSWWFALDATATNPNGQSRLCGAPEKTFGQREELFWVRDEAVKRFGLGVAVVRGLPERTDGDNNGYDNLEAMKSAYMGARAGGCIALNGERAANGEFIDSIEMLTDGGDVEPIDATIDGTDAEALRSLGIPEKTILEGGDVGSYALVTEQTRVLLSVCEEILSQLVDSYKRWVVDYGAARNFGAGPDSPVFVMDFPRLSGRPDGLVIDVAKALVTTPTLSPLVQLLDVARIFELAGLPLSPNAKQKADAIILKATTPATQLPQTPPGVPGNADVPPVAGNATGANVASQGPQDVAASLARTEAGGNRSGFPTQAEVETETLRLVEIAYERFRATLRMLYSRGKGRDLAAISSAVRILVLALRKIGISARVASNLAGRISPWMPQIQDVPSGQPKGDKVDVTLSLFGVPLMAGARAPDWFEGVQCAADDLFDTGMAFKPPKAFPFISSALKWLADRNAVTHEDYAALNADARRNAFTIKGVANVESIAGIASEITQSFAFGETEDEFVSRTEDLMADAGLTEPQAKTIFRTETHRAYIDGFDKTIASPLVAKYLGFVQFAATDDTRVRDEHWALDGVVAAVGTEVYRVLRKAAEDFNCRCALIPLQIEVATSKGVIRSLQELEAHVTQRHGADAWQKIRNKYVVA